MEDKSTAAETAVEDVLPRYKKTALLVSTYFMLLMILRYVINFIEGAFIVAFRGSISNDALYISELTLSALFLQVLPAVLGALMFRYIGKDARGIRSLYTVSKSTNRAISNFSAVYGIGQVFNIATIAVMFILTNKADLAKRLNTVVESAPGMASAWFMVFLLVVIAPVFEEFVFRGVILNELRPYGAGISIFVSGVTFGLYHGNFQQCFYTMAVGTAMAYIAYVTGSILPTTIIHAIMNSFAAVLQLITATDPVQRYIIGRDSSDIPDNEMIWVAVYGVYMICLIIFIVASIAIGIGKLKKVLRHKPPKVCGEIPAGRKAVILLTTVPAILSVIMIVDTFGGFSIPLIVKLVGAGA